MGKKTFIAAIIATGLLFSLAGMQFVEVVMANPIALFWLPTNPDTSQPELVLHSPLENKAYNVGQVSLNFTINKPESWFGFESSMRYCNGKILSIQYSLDGVDSQNISVNDTNIMTPYYSQLSRTLDCSLNLNAKQGAHTLSMKVFAGSYYWTQENRHAAPANFTVEVYEIVINSTETAFYVVSPNPTPSPSLKPTASPSPTKQPTPSPTLMPSITETHSSSPTPTSSASPRLHPTLEPTLAISVEPSSSWILPYFIIGLVAIIITAAAYFVKQKRKKQTSVRVN